MRACAGRFNHSGRLTQGLQSQRAPVTFGIGIFAPPLQNEINERPDLERQMLAAYIHKVQGCTGSAPGSDTRGAATNSSLKIGSKKKKKLVRQRPETDACSDRNWRRQPTHG